MAMLNVFIFKIVLLLSYLSIRISECDGCKNIKCNYGYKCYYKQYEYGPDCYRIGDAIPYIGCNGIT